MLNNNDNHATNRCSLLDKGTDIRFIKDLPGHFDIKTTERYLHVSKKQLVNIVSSLDDLWAKGSIEW